MVGPRAGRSGWSLGAHAVSAAHALEALGVGTLDRLVRAIGWPPSRALGAGLGAALGAAGLRRRVARENLARAFPTLPLPEREAILARHYRELGRVALEYPLIPQLSVAPMGDVFAAVHGFEHIEGALAGGRGAIFLSGHFGNFELGAAWLARRCPVDLVVRPLSNPRVDAWLSDLRRRAGFGLIRADVGVRAVFESLRAGRAIAMLADQDARKHGVFVPFLGVPASTPVGPARVALATGAPIVTGYVTRREDGRHELDIEPPLVEQGRDASAALRLTARHTDRLTARVRQHPEAWFWLHRRWKTAPPAGVGAAAGEGTAPAADDRAARAGGA